MLNTVGAVESWGIAQREPNIPPPVKVNCSQCDLMGASSQVNLGRSSRTDSVPASLKQLLLSKLIVRNYWDNDSRSELSNMNESNTNSFCSVLAF